MFMFDDFLSGLLRSDVLLSMCVDIPSCSIGIRAQVLWYFATCYVEEHPWRSHFNRGGGPGWWFGWPINCQATEHAKSSPSRTNLSDLKGNMGKNEGIAQCQLQSSHMGFQFVSVRRKSRIELQHHLQVLIEDRSRWHWNYTIYLWCSQRNTLCKSWTFCRILGRKLAEVGIFQWYRPWSDPIRIIVPPDVSNRWVRVRNQQFLPATLCKQGTGPGMPICEWVVNTRNYTNGEPPNDPNIAFFLRGKSPGSGHPYGNTTCCNVAKCEPPNPGETGNESRSMGSSPEIIQVLLVFFGGFIQKGPKKSQKNPACRDIPWYNDLE